MKNDRPNTVTPRLISKANSCRTGARILAVMLVMGLLPSMTGCASVITLAAQRIITGAGIISLASTGKGLSDHALDMITQQDCRILDGIMREERGVCEKPGSLATRNDFKGLMVASTAQEQTQAEASQVQESSPAPLELQLANETNSYSGATNPQPITVPVEKHVGDNELELDITLHPNTEQERVPSRSIAKLNAVLTVVH